MDLSDTTENLNVSADQDEKETKMINLEEAKAKKSDEAKSLSKFWNWATQLF
jgi:hypothetical protein